ncbi:hypothetical protein [Arachidicoccus sp.]|uniref:hypothetical protein n=1 Tax=Arachidicoccus sp. TaxID=1872624 RepID=UPI003D1B9EB2
MLSVGVAVSGLALVLQAHDLKLEPLCVLNAVLHPDHIPAQGLEEEIEAAVEEMFLEAADAVATPLCGGTLVIVGPGQNFSLYNNNFTSSVLMLRT